MTTERDPTHMARALAQARLAAAQGEVPVGAVLVRPGPAGDEVLAEAHNRPIGHCDPTAHAEMLALREAAQRLGNYRLDGCVLYVTLEPCAMCAQALLHARVARVVYAAREPKTGAAGSVLDLFALPQLNHQTVVEGGLMADASSELLQTFFAGRRQTAKALAQPLRPDALRTPAAALAPVWDALAGLQAQHQTWSWPHLQGLQMHALDWPGTGDGDVWLALHSPTAWGVQWADWAAQQAAHGDRVLVPDLLGFGASDKPKKPRWHTLQAHAQAVLGAMAALGIPAWRVVATPEQAALAAHLQALAPEAVLGVMWLEPTPPPGLPADWRDRPYPDAGHRAGPRAWPWPPGEAGGWA